MARRFYNGSARDYNVLVDSFPSNLIAGKFQFEKRDYFELDPAEAAEVRKVPNVSF
jgi:LemA protein